MANLSQDDASSRAHVISGVCHLGRMRDQGFDPRVVIDAGAAQATGPFLSADPPPGSACRDRAASIYASELSALAEDDRIELLHVLMLPDFERADRIGEFWGNGRLAPSPSCSSTARRTGRCGRAGRHAARGRTLGSLLEPNGEPARTPEPGDG
jgi:hypothetical protein